MLSAEGIKARRFKVRQIMREADLMGKQLGFASIYTCKSTEARLGIPDLQKRELSVSAPNSVW